MEKNFLKELFRLTIVHQKYPRGTAGLFNFEPSGPGIKNLESYHLHYKNKEDGFVIAAPYIKKEQDDFEIKHPFRKDAKLSFAIFTNDELFFDKSELPITPPGKFVYYFNNLDGAVKRTSLLLDIDGITADERVLLHSKKFEFKKGDIMPVPLPPVVYDHKGIKIPDTVYDHYDDKIKNQYVVDLSRLEDGLYSIEYINLESEQLETIEYYCAKDSFIRRIPIIIVEIFVSDDVPEKYRIIKHENNTQYIEPKPFKLHFGNYRFIWRYNIVPAGSVSHSVWTRVETNDVNFTFSPEKLRNNHNHDPMIFTADQVILLSNMDVEPSLYKCNWNNDCAITWHKYKYCNKNYGIWVDGVFKCRYYNSVDGYKYDCPAVYTTGLIDKLPRPDEVHTEYYHEDDKYIAEMKMLLYYQDSQLYIREYEGCDEGHDDD